MDEERLKEMAWRLDQVAREVRWHRRFSVVLALLLAGIALAPPLAGARGATAELQARRFRPRGARWHAPGAFEATTAGLPRLTLSSGGTLRAELALEAGGTPSLRLLGPTGERRIARLGSPVVQFLDEKGFARTGLSTFNADTGVAVISQADGKTPGLVLLGKGRTGLWSVPLGSPPAA